MRKHALCLEQVRPFCLQIENGDRFRNDVESLRIVCFLYEIWNLVIGKPSGKGCLHRFLVLALGVSRFTFWEVGRAVVDAAVAVVVLGPCVLLARCRHPSGASVGDRDSSWLRSRLYSSIASSENRSQYRSTCHRFHQWMMLGIWPRSVGQWLPTSSFRGCPEGCRRSGEPSPALQMEAAAHSAPGKTLNCGETSLPTKSQTHEPN